ncbi:MAG TPA: TerC family protein, partial [Nitrospirae bacterium]|nr:TerC family protein [Nitrospirota bacterium]
MADSFALLSLLIALELVLGVDNILVISIFVERVSESQRNKARVLGLAIALLARIVMLMVLLKFATHTSNILFSFSIRDIILLAGGLFLLYKAVREIHNTIELKEEHDPYVNTGTKTFFSVITQIVILDIVFSVDSVITAIGLTNKIWIIIAAVIVSFLVILAFAKPVGDFILQRPSLKIL